jgi:hypothetical protein
VPPTGRRYSIRPIDGRLVSVAGSSNRLATFLDAARIVAMPCSFRRARLIGNLGVAYLAYNPQPQQKLRRIGAVIAIWPRDEVWDIKPYALGHRSGKLLHTATQNVGTTGVGSRATAAQLSSAKGEASLAG